MPDLDALPHQFEMISTRAVLRDSPVSPAIEQQVDAIENALLSVPDFAFDLSKTLVESVCKTVLSDLGEVSNPKWDAPKLFKETVRHLNLLPRDHPDPTRASDSVTKTVRGMLQTVQGLCELRNSYGMASHGRDGFSARLEVRQATLAAQAADTIVSFLFRIHRDSLVGAPGARVYYEDHAAFNEWFDLENDLVRIGELELLPSRVLFHADREAYKVALLDFVSDPDDDDTAEEQRVGD